MNSECECGKYEMCACTQHVEEDEEDDYAWFDDFISDTDDLIWMDEDFYREDE